MRALVTVLCLVMLGGCDESRPSAATPPLVGGDRDAHGCIGSAGYLWCEREGRCERPWELAAARGFPNTEEAVKSWCSGHR